MQRDSAQAQPTPEPKGAERRREKRYEVELAGELRFDGVVIPVRVADLSASGALIMVSDPPPAGSVVELWIPDFGSLDVEIMHAGDNFAGVALIDPAKHRERLMIWLREDATPASASG